MALTKRLEKGSPLTAQEHDANVEQINQNQLNITTLQNNQVSGVVTYTTFANLPATGVANVLYRVTNDPTSSNNAYWTWNGSSYDKAAQTLPEQNESDVNTIYNLIGDENVIDALEGDIATALVTHNEDLQNHFLNQQVLLEGSDAFAHAKRVKQDGGTTIDILPLDEKIRDIRQKSSLFITPHSTKNGKIYAQLPIDGLGDLIYSRLGKLTHYDKYGIERTADDNTPAIEFDFNGDPYIPFVRPVTNLLEWSSDINQTEWVKVRGTPSYVNGVSKFTEDTSNSTHYFEQIISQNDGGFIIQVKLEPSGVSKIRLAAITVGDSSGLEKFTDFDLVSLTKSNETQVNGSGIERLPDGKVNCWIQYSCDVNVTSHRVRVYSKKDTTISYLGDGASGFLIYNVDWKEISLLTPHIYTDTSIKTLYSSSLESADISSLINRDNFSFKVNIAAFHDVVGLGDRSISLNDGTTSNRVAITYTNAANQINVSVRLGAIDELSINITPPSVLNFNTIELSKNVNDFSVYLNEDETPIYTQTISNTSLFSTINKLSFDSGSNGNRFEGKFKSLKISNN